MSGAGEFVGTITGLGTAAGTRIVIGDWRVSPLGAFTDVMVERADGHRVLLAPDARVADFVTSTYSFDEVRIEPVVAEETVSRVGVRSTSLEVEATIGRRTLLGWMLRAVPRAVRTRRWWARLTDPMARLRGVRTIGTAGNGRVEWYAAKDLHAVSDVRAVWEGTDLGALADVRPPVRFGFGSTPATPSRVEVSSFVADATPPS